MANAKVYRTLLLRQETSYYIPTYSENLILTPAINQTPAQT
mgnify:CR=1 FL=1|jgi:hypothetical protein